VIAAVLVALAVCSPPPALPDALDRASVAFVGRVERVTDGGATARVRVEQVWKGARILDRVTVIGDGRTYEPDTRYLFVPQRAGGRFRDPDCSATREYSAEVAQFAPGTVTLPRRSSSGSSGLATQAAIALAVVLTVVVTRVAVVRLRGRRAPTPS
jgi:hypothetical protein